MAMSSNFLKKIVVNKFTKKVFRYARKKLCAEILNEQERCFNAQMAAVNELKENIIHMQKKNQVLLQARRLPSQDDQSPQFIVTLTSYGRRLSTTLPYTVCSLLNQSVMPCKIVLYVTHGSSIPFVLEKLVQANSLELRFCEDIKSYKKLIPALQDFPEDVLITADDDICYPFDWLADLKEAYEKDPSKIYCHRAHEIVFDSNGNIAPYTEWKPCIRHSLYPTRIFSTGGGGTLYPPHSLDKMCVDKKIFMSLAPRADDIWFWAMAKLKGTEFSIVNSRSPVITDEFDPSEMGECLYHDNVIQGGNDTQLEAVLNYFPALQECVKDMYYIKDSADYWKSRYLSGGGGGGY
jgi:hypothetical protein